MTEADQFISDLTKEVHPEIGEWVKELLSEGKTIKEVKEAMQRMVEIASYFR